MNTTIGRILISAWACAAATAQPVSAAGESALWRVLSDNGLSGEPAIETGVTYTADPAFANPADSTGRRLVNRDPEGGNWNDVAGINFTDQTLVFDLQAGRGVGKVQLLFAHDTKPASVEIGLSDGQDGPWRPFGSISPEGKTGWYDCAVETARPARYVKLHFKLANWGWYLNEVKIWGLRGDEPGPETVLPSEQDSAGNLLLAREGNPRASIVVAADPGGKALAAACDLQDHVFKMSGAVLPIRTDDRCWTGTRLLVGPSKDLDKAGVKAPSGFPRNERIIVKTVGTCVVLVGNDEGSFTGTEFAVQTLLEQLGCGWFGPDPLWQPVPKKPTLAMPPLDIEHTPAFQHRNVWIGLGKRWYQGGTDLGIGHSHDGLFPPSEYFQDHPEYYALIGGKRTAEGEWQLCTSNPDVIRLTVEKARQCFDADPERTMFSLGNNDCGGFCECEACGRTGSNPGARMLSFANAVARELRQTHPDRRVANYAYWYTYTAPPEEIRAEPGVVVVPVGQGCHVHPISAETCPNTGFRANFDRWAATGAGMGFYEWYIPGCSDQNWRRIPWVAGRTALDDQRYLRSKGVQWVTYESQHGYEEKAYPLRWPLFYVAAKGMWDAGLTFEGIMEDACAKLYGPAAPPMVRYYADLESAMRNCPEHASIWNLPNPLSVYPPDAQARLSRHLTEAWEAARSAAPEVRQRIAAEREMWELAVQTMDGLRKAAEASQKKSFTITYNDLPYVVDRETVTGRYLRALFGILGEQRLILDQAGQERDVRADDDVAIVDGMRFRTAP